MSFQSNRVLRNAFIESAGVDPKPYAKHDFAATLDECAGSAGLGDRMGFASLGVLASYKDPARVQALLKDPEQMTPVDAHDLGFMLRRKKELDASTNGADKAPRTDTPPEGGYQYMTIRYITPKKGGHSRGGGYDSGAP